MKKIITKLSEIAGYAAASFRLGVTPLQSVLLLYLFLRLYLNDYFHFMLALLPVPGTIRIKHESGRRCRLSVPDDITFVVALSEIFVKKDYDLQLSPRPELILDIGANFGLAAAFFALNYPQARIYSFEPAAGNFLYLAENSTQFPNVEIFRTAIYSRNGSIRLYTHKSAGGWNSVHGTTNDYSEVNCITLDSFIASKGIKNIDLVKIDVEGAEWEILKDCNSLRNIQAMAGELHFSFIDRQKMINLLNANFSAVTLYGDAPQRPLFRALCPRHGKAAETL